MVNEVTAFSDAAGNLHKTKLAALQADAVAVLDKMDIFNHASAQAIVKQAIKVHEVLDPLVEHLEELNAQPGALD